MRGGLVLWALLIVLGCNHVGLDVRVDSLTPGQRVSTFQSMRPYVQIYRERVTFDSYGTRVTTSDTLVLADGTRIVHADDLLPLLPASEPAARAARRSASARQRKWISIAVGLAAVAVGAVWFSKSVRDWADGADSREPWPPIAIAGAGGLIGAVGGWYYGEAEQDERVIAFAMYEPALARALNVCAAGVRIVPCEEGTPVAFEPTRAPPRSSRRRGWRAP